MSKKIGLAGLGLIVASLWNPFSSKEIISEVDLDSYIPPVEIYYTQPIAPIFTSTKDNKPVVTGPPNPNLPKPNLDGSPLEQIAYHEKNENWLEASFIAAILFLKRSFSSENPYMCTIAPGFAR